MGKFTVGLLLLIGFIVGVSTSSVAQTANITSPNPVPGVICSGDTILFVADDNSGTITSFQWNFNGAAFGPQTLFGQNVTFIAGTSNLTPYNLQLVVSNGTTFDTLNFTLTVNACNSPIIDISGTPKTVCEGTQVQFTDATTGPSPLTGRFWLFPGGSPATSTLINPIITYPTAGTYDVFYKIEDANGIYRDTLVAYIDVVNCPSPVAQFSAADRRICPGVCINFTDESLNMVMGQSTWDWSFPGADSSSSSQQHPNNICYQIPGVYPVVLTATNATGTDTETKLQYITVDSCLPPVANFTIEKEKICQGTCVRFKNTSQREDSVSWVFFGVDPTYEFSSENEPIVCYSNEGDFRVEMLAFNPYGGPNLKSDSISVLRFPTIQAPADTSVLIGQSVRLQAYGSGTGFRWSPNDGSIDCEFCSRVNVSPLENTKYFVTNINENGCEKTDSVNVVVVKNYYSGVPDIFSPNDDGENDLFKVLGNGIKKMEFYVYNRQGKKIFESRDQSIGWDGTFKGENVEIGVYVYFVMLTYESGFQEILKGDVTLVR